MEFTRVDQIVQWRLCLGCGACAYACPVDVIKMIDMLDQGIRPLINEKNCLECGNCVKVCPGIEISHKQFNKQTIPKLRQAWGPVLEVWEGFATNPEIRLKGSSGGIVTAMALFCLEEKQMVGVLHTGANPETRWKNVPVFSKDILGLLACTGSRYSPAAPCEKLDWIEQANSPCMFVGKPCDVVALRKSQALNPELNNKVGLAISIFCAGTPSHKGTEVLLKTLRVKPEQIQEIRYRGCGWPGMTSVRIKSDSNHVRMMPYEKSWGTILSHYRQFRCWLCPDSTGEFADISCGDPWYRVEEPCEPGRSLVLVRTEKGKAALQNAIDAGYIEAEKIAPEALPLSQRSLLDRRRRLWGRLMMMQIMRTIVPHYKGFSLFANWWHLPTFDKMRSILGTLRQIYLSKANGKAQHNIKSMCDLK